jgi:hypothetical protein
MLPYPFNVLPNKPRTFSLLTTHRNNKYGLIFLCNHFNLLAMNEIENWVKFAFNRFLKSIRNTCLTCLRLGGAYQFPTSIQHHLL